ncbi:MAG: sugar phosphate isomerase/epimerase [Verrucomicrobia bacterium]|nr:sugar phosphate isomerase/epimerase [Verrucomicrobiota bacterium]
MIRSAITVSLAPEAGSRPFVYAGELPVACTRAASLGYDAIELIPAANRTVDVEECREVLERFGLRLAALGTDAGWLTRQLTLTSHSSGKRSQALEFIKAVLAQAGELKAPVIVGAMQGRAEEGVSREQALGWLAQAFRELDALATKLEVPIFFAPLNRYETNLLNRLEDAVTFLQLARTTRFRLLAGLFHMNIEEARLPDALRVAAPYLGHVHFADSNRLAPGFGHTDFGPIAATLRELDYDGYISAEVYPLPNPETSARQSIAAFRDWFGAP